MAGNFQAAASTWLWLQSCGRGEPNVGDLTVGFGVDVMTGAWQMTKVVSFSQHSTLAHCYYASPVFN